MFWEEVLRLSCAIAAGAAIGLEREIHDKPAGFRTNILICFGAALFTILSQRMAGVTGGDPARIAAQIVSGIGFLGAGAIIHLRTSVLGLTTAATIWSVASVGMAFGAGAYATGAVAVALVCAVLYVLAAAETRIARWRTTVQLRLRMAGTLQDADALREELLRSGVRARGWELSKQGGELVVQTRLTGAEEHVRMLERSLTARPQVLTLERL